MQEFAQLFNYPLELWICMLVGGLCFAAVYVFQSIGLFTIARREGYPHIWMAFVPFFNTYYIGVCGQKNRFFNVDTRKLSLAAGIIEAVLFAVYTVYFVALFILDARGYIEVVRTVEEFGVTVETMGLPDTFNAEHPSFAWAGWCYNYLDIISAVLEIVYLFVLVLVLNCFFQTYSARHYFLFTIACVLFPIQGIMIFVVRRNKAMSYGEYMRRVQEQAYRQYRSQQNYYGNPYDGNNYNNNYNGNYNNGDPYRGENNAGQDNPDRREQPEDPFPEYGGDKNGDDPFDEFKN